MRIARFLVQGVDVWLNNPRRPLEASGTSGHEGRHERGRQRQRPRRLVGRGLRGRQRLGDRRPRDERRRGRPGLDRRAGPLPDPRGGDRPRYYDRDASGLPRRWVETDAALDGSTLWRFSTTRMLHEYVERLYLPAAGVPVPVEHARADRRPRRADRRLAGVPPYVPTRISFALAIHNHQPVGNFGWVFAEVFDLAYAPLVDALERHPERARLAPLHRSAARVAARRAPGLRRPAARLVASGQVEILGGGWYEPVLASLPERDRVGQLTRMADELEALIGRRPRGAWLAERVWEPSLPSSLRRRRVRLDDPRRRALPRRVDPRGAALGRLRDRGPGRARDGVRHRAGAALPDPVRHGRGHHRPPAGQCDRGRDARRDDGRRRREVRRVADDLRALLGRGPLDGAVLRGARGERRLAPDRHPTAWLAEHPPIGRVYVPTGSYAEMGEWSLPPDESRAYSAALHHATDADLPERRWLRGGFWRNFQVKYREINDLHKQMLRTSAKVDAMPDGAGEGAGARPPLPRPVERLLLARAVRRDLHQPHAPRDVRAPDRRRGSRRRRRVGTVRSRRPLTPTSTGSTRRFSPGAGRRRRRARRGRGDRQLGHPGRASRAGGGAAAAARGVARDAPPARGGRDGRRDRAARHRSTR